jgi:molybdopterin molybdotransferase
MPAVISVEEALSVIASNAPAGAAEEVPLREALGRVLAAQVRSDVDWPPFDTSAMDGYAVRLADLPGPGSSLPETGKTVSAGDPPPPPLQAGTALRVMTGAPIPGGTEAVVPVERVRRADQCVVFDMVPAPGAHLRRRGESIRAGSVLVERGRRIAPGDLALAAVAGADPLKVVVRPRVSIAATGNELVPAGRPLLPGQIRDSNGPMLLALCRARGWPARERARVADEAPELSALFASAGSEEEVLVTSGGVSAGDLDLVPAIARQEGFEILFHGVSVRPGKPVAFGRRGRTLWFGLPGNPVSSSVCFHLFVRFALDCLEGDSAPGARRVRAQLAGDLPPGGARESYRDAKLSNVNGVLRVEPVATAGSHDIRAHAVADALIRIPANANSQPAGTAVECVLL